jgi:Fur family transcriptional regulator, ferric uptake regulator
MTRAPDVSRLRFSSFADAVAEMRRRGLRLSTSRRLVLQALFAADGPCSAEHLAHGLDLDLASVYRNLDVLERHGLAQHVHLGHGPGLYALVGHGEHEYLYCERCGAVRAVAPDELDPLRASLRDRFGYEARFTHHAIVGTCPRCASDDGRDARSEADDDAGAQERPRGSPHAHPRGGTGHQQLDHAHEHSHGDYVHSHTAERG